MDSNIPNELNGPLPRKVRATGSGTYLVFLASACLAFTVVAGLWAGTNIVQQEKHRAALRSDGSVAMGTVTRLRRGKNLAVVYYTFKLNGKSYANNADVPWELENDVERSSNSLPVRYLPANPDVNHPTSWEWSLFYWLPLNTDLVHLPNFSRELNWLMAGFLSGVLGVPIFLSLRGDRKLLAEGIPVPGVVTKCTRGSRGSYSVKYEFRTKGGSVTKGSSGGNYCKEIGASLCILYLPQNPQRNKPYPSPIYRVVE